MNTPSWQDYYDVGLYTLQVRRPSLVVYPGDVTDAVVAGTATTAMTLQGYGAGRFKICFLDGAFDDDLTALCHDKGVDRELGAQSVGQVTFSRVAATLGAGTIPAGTQVATEPDSTGTFQTFTTNTDLVFGVLDLTKTVDAKCVVIDVVGNVAFNTVDRILNISLLWDSSLTVVNADKFSGGAPEESDPDLRDRTRQFWITQARGTIDALSYAARLVPGVQRVSVVVDDSGVVTVYVADLEGNSNQAMADAVAAVIEGPPAWRDAADIVTVIGASLVTVTITLTLAVRVGVDVTTLLDRIRSAVIAAVNQLQPGDTLYRDLISAAARAVDQDSIVSVLVVTPAVDLVPAASQAIATDDAHVGYA
jgi:uncharacterized phage protein gp47/JayE